MQKYETTFTQFVVPDDSMAFQFLNITDLINTVFLSTTYLDFLT